MNLKSKRNGEIMKFILASASPRRKELFGQICKEFDIIPSSVAEIIPLNIEIEKVPELLASQKAADVAAQHPNSVVIGSDTGVFIDGEMLGKPRDRNDATAMLRRLSDRTHKVITGCSIIQGKRELHFSQTTEVTFYPLSDEEIKAYVASGECDDKAGSYGIQGKGMLLVKEIKGDYFNVVGLPVGKLSRKLNEFLIK